MWGSKNPCASNIVILLTLLKIHKEYKGITIQNGRKTAVANTQQRNYQYFQHIKSNYKLYLNSEEQTTIFWLRPHSSTNDHIRFRQLYLSRFTFDSPKASQAKSTGSGPVYSRSPESVATRVAYSLFTIIAPLSSCRFKSSMF